MKPTTLQPDHSNQLAGRFQGALDFLKKTVITKHHKEVSLIHLPWFLMIGPAQSGKTTLLANSQINYILSKQFKSETVGDIHASKECDWWVTRDLTLLDVPSRYLAKNPEEEAQPNFQNLLDLIKTSHAKGLKGVAIALNLPEIMKKNSQQKTKFIGELKRAILQLQSQFGEQLPFYFIITKCDLISGFTEFFSESGTDELGQAWGITLPTLEKNEKLTEVFSNRFNALIKRLNKQLLSRLHQERNALARPLIKDFPLHVERVKNAMENVLKALQLPQFNVQGVYLTSITKPEIHFPHSQETALEIGSTQALQLLKSPTLPSRTYFVRQLIQQGLLTTPDIITPVDEDSESLRHKFKIGAIAAGVLAVSILSYDFLSGWHNTRLIEQSLTQYQQFLQNPSQFNGHLAKALPLLHTLQAATDYSQHRLSLASKVFSYFSTQSQQTANEVYQQALHTIVITEAKQQLENYLKTSLQKNAENSYLALKAYLMLNDPDKRDVNFIAESVNYITHSKLSKPEINELATHLSCALTSNSIDLNQTLVADVRKFFTTLPGVELAMIMLKNTGENSQNSTLSLDGHEQKALLTMYTGSHFKQIVTEGIGIAARDATEGNWIVGQIKAKIPQPDEINADLGEISSQLYDLYVANYARTWENIIASIQLPVPVNLAQTDAMVERLISNNSPLNQLISTIKENTGFEAVLMLSPRAQQINNVDSVLKVGVSELRKMHIILKKTLQAKNTNRMAYLITTQIHKLKHNPIEGLKEVAEQSPDPVKTLFTIIADRSWMYMQQSANRYQTPKKIG